MQVLIYQLRKLSGGRVLDVATGRGNFIHYLAEGLKDFDSITGIDYIDESVLEQVSKSFQDSRIYFLRMDASKMEYPDSSFDIVTLSNSLHHLKDMNAVLQEIMRVLKPGGAFILNEMICDNQSPSQMTYVLMHHWWAKIDMELGKLHYETFPRQKVLDIVKGLNLSSYEVFEFNDPDDPMDKESLENISRIIDEYINRAKGLERFEAYRQEGEEIRKRLFEVGVKAATQVIVIGKK